MKVSRPPTRSVAYRVRFCVGLLVMAALAPFAIRDSQTALASMFNYPASWLPDSMPVRTDYEQFKRLFGGDDILQFGWAGSRIGSPDLQRAKDALLPYTHGNEDRPAYLTSVFTGQEVLDRLMAPPSSFSQRSAQARLRGTVVGPSAEQTVLLASDTTDGARQRRVMIERYRADIAAAVGIDPTEVYLVGPPIDGAVIDHEAFRSIQRFTVPSFLVGALICVICLRSILLSATVLSVALIGQGASLAAVGWAGLDMNAILIVLPPLVLVLTASAGIHLSNYYLDALRSDPEAPPIQAVDRALAMGVGPCWLAASTTIVGLGSLGLVHLWPVSAFGLIAAAATFLTLTLLMLLLPGTMLAHGWFWQRRRHRVATTTDALVLEPTETAPWRRWIRRPLDHGSAIVVAFTALTLGCGYGLPRLTTSVNIPRMFPPDSRIRGDYEWFEKNIGPTINAELLIAFAPGSVNDPLDRFLLVRDIDDKLRTHPDVGGVLSPRTFLPSPPSSTNHSLAATALKASIRSQISDPQSALRTSGTIATNDVGEQLWRISFRFPFDESIDYRATYQDVQAEIDPYLQSLAAKAAGTSTASLGRGVRAIYTGGMPLTTTTQDVLLRDLFRSFLAAFAIVGLMMIVVLRSFAGGLLAMFPNLFPTIALFGFMGLAQMPLDIGSVMTASVALGIAVDGTVHLLSRFRTARRTRPDRREAVIEALRHCGPAMWQTTAVCAISPLVYALSDFLPTQRFALMMFGLLSAALVGDVVLLPAILVSPLGRWFRPPGADVAAAQRPQRNAKNIASRPTRSAAPSR